MRLSGLKRFMIIVSALVILSAFIHYILIPNPSSPFFSPYRFKSIFYSQESINHIFRDHTYPGMSRNELEEIIFGADGWINRSGFSADKTKHPGWGYGYINMDKLHGINAETYTDYQMPNIGISNLSPNRVITAHYDENETLRVLFMNGNLIIPH